MTRIEDSFCLESLSRVDLKCDKNIKSTINGSTAEGSYLMKIYKSQENLSTSQHDDDTTDHSSRHVSKRYDVCITCYKPLSKHPSVYNRIHTGEGHPAVMRMLKHCLNKLQNLNTVVLIKERRDILVLSVVNHTMFRVLFHNTFHCLNVHIIIFFFCRNTIFNTTTST